MWRNTSKSYGLVSIGLHWLLAVAIIGLFALGLWMVELSYYHDWYNRAPAIHKSAGILAGGAMLLRLAWRLLNQRPAFEAQLALWERTGALAAHWAMYATTLVVVASGYLIPTAAGDPVSVFGWFELPPVVLGINGQEDIAGWVHYYAAWLLIVIAGVHTLAALKHHWLNGDRTLIKMLRPGE